MVALLHPHFVKEEGRAEKRPDAARFAEKLRLHAETEEQVLYPAAILVGEQVQARLGT